MMPSTEPDVWSDDEGSTNVAINEATAAAARGNARAKTSDGDDIGSDKVLVTGPITAANSSTAATGNIPDNDRHGDRNDKIKDAGGDVNSNDHDKHNDSGRSTATDKAAPDDSPNRTEPWRMIALFGSSLNPVTHAHVAIVRALSEKKKNQHQHLPQHSVTEYAPRQSSQAHSEQPTETAELDQKKVQSPPRQQEEYLFDEIWVLPVFGHPDAEKYKHVESLDSRSKQQEHQLRIVRKKSFLRQSFDQRVHLCKVC